jgi:hypothetical protein
VFVLLSRSASLKLIEVVASHQRVSYSAQQVLFGTAVTCLSKPFALRHETPAVPSASGRVHLCMRIATQSLDASVISRVIPIALIWHWTHFSARFDRAVDDGRSS